MSDKKLNDVDYLYVSGLAGARAGSMVTAALAEKMLEAPNFAEAARLLTACGYPDMSGMDAAEIEDALSARRAEIFAEVDSVAARREVVDIFRLRYDYHNAKALVKAEGAGVGAAHLLSDCGRFTPEALTRAFRRGRFFGFPRELENGLIEAKSVLARTENAALADAALDKAYAAEMLAAAKRTGSAFVEEYVKMIADGADVGAVSRFLADAKTVGFGVDTVAAFLAAVEREIVLVRLVLTGALAGIGTERLRERLVGMGFAASKTAVEVGS